MAGNIITNKNNANTNINKTIVNFEGLKSNDSDIAVELAFKDMSTTNEGDKFIIEYDSSQNGLHFKSIDENGSNTLLTLSKHHNIDNSIVDLSNNVDTIKSDLQSQITDLSNNTSSSISSSDNFSANNIDVSNGTINNLKNDKIYSIDSTYTNGSGFQFNDGEILPINKNGTTTSSTVDLGSSTTRFHNLFLDGSITTNNINVNNMIRIQSHGPDAYIFNNYNNGQCGIAFSDQYVVPTDGNGHVVGGNGNISLGTPSYKWKDLYISGHVSAGSITTTGQLNTGTIKSGNITTTGTLNTGAIKSSGTIVIGHSGKIITDTLGIIETGTYGEIKTGIYGHIKTGNSANIYVNGFIEVQSGVMTSSDKRIKTDIEDVPDHLALQQVRDLPARYYGYKDVNTKGTDKTIGYIAQEVKEVLPMAVTETTKIIPNEYHMIENPEWEEIIDLSGNVKFNLIVSSVDFSDNTYMNEHGVTDISGVKYEFYVTNDLSENDISNKPQLIGNLDNRSFTFDKKWSYVFMYGREVDDFLTIDKAKICALHHASIQEIDRLQTQNIEKIQLLLSDNESLKQENETMKEENQRLNQEIITLKTDLEAIKQHLGL